MNHVWLVFKGWMNPDSSPSLYGAFTSLEKAKEFSSELRQADVVRHLTNYGDQHGTIVWHNRTVRNICYDNSETALPESWEDYWESRTTYNDTDEDPFSGITDDVIYIQKIQLDAKNLCD